MMRVVYWSDVKDKDLQFLEEGLDEEIELTNIPRDDEEELVEKAERFDTIIGAWVPYEFLEKADNLKYFIIPFAGVPKRDRENLRDFDDITVINSHFNSWLVAEHAWTLLSALVKRICPIHERLKKGDWTPRYDHWCGRTLKDKHLLLLGCGAIGRDIAKIAMVFDMKVSAVKRTYEEVPNVDQVGTGDDLHDFLSKADFVISTLPFTGETERYIGEEEFKVMKDDSYLVNVGRGPVIDEKALYQALKEGKIAGAAIDTWWNYPKGKDSRKNTSPSDYPLNEFDNVVFSPHRSSQVEEIERYRMESLVKILNSLNEGKLINIVDIERGY
ncbi:MAG: 2-hydroxyacid dehydrogenase [Candidatus Saliniplasma sp.]